MELNRKKKVVIITSGQPTLNPRLVKEADSLMDANYEVTVLYAYWNDWGTNLDKELLPGKKWEAICVGGDPHKHKLAYFFSRLIHWFAKMISKKTKGRYLGDLAIARAAYFLLRETPKHDADIYIGHNLAALPATVKAARINKKPCGFDAEDLHRFEISDDLTNQDVILKSAIENKYIPRVNYLTASSPLIGAAYRQFFPDKYPIVIRNVFDTDPEVKPAVINDKQPIRLFWFSQTIGSSRGLEEVVKALEILKDHLFELHLLGSYTDAIKDSFTRANDVVIKFYQPIPPDKVIKFASQFDIGLATEMNKPYNRDICLTNKIFTYLQAGLVIVASDTKSQSQFLNEYPDVGKIYKNGAPEELASVLLFYHQNRDKLWEARNAAFTIAHAKLNWKNESKKFLALVEQTLNSN